MSKTVEHATFIIERRYDFAPEAVFKAFADPQAKRKWFVDGEGWTTDSYEADFRTGGFERSRFRFVMGRRWATRRSISTSLPAGAS